MKRTLLLIGCLMFAGSAISGQLEGLFRITGGFFATSGVLTGDIDVASGTLQLDATTIYGVGATFLVTELLTPGTYTRTHNLSGGGSITRTATIPGGRTGVYLVIQSNGNEYQLFNAWSVNPAGTVFTSTNISGNIFIGGSLNGKRGHADFTIPPPPPPVLNTTVTIDGGLSQECTQTNGSMITASAVVVESSGAVLDRVEWSLDGAFIGMGSSVSSFVPLGMHTIEANAIATDGVTMAADSAQVNIIDTTAPDLQVQFLDGTGAAVSTASLGAYQIHFEVTDICDPSPIASGTAVPVMDVIEGDEVVINSITDVILPTTAVEVTATAIDASGRSRISQGVLLIE